MKLIAAMILCATLAQAGDFDPVTWYRTSGTNEIPVYWQQFGAWQFPRFDGTTNKHLVIAVPVATWSGANPTKKQAIIARARIWLHGDEEINIQRINELKATLADVNIGVALCMDATSQLAAWNLHPATNALP